jgi:hypothetical protein
MLGQTKQRNMIPPKRERDNSPVTESGKEIYKMHDKKSKTLIPRKLSKMQVLQ